MTRFRLLFIPVGLVALSMTFAAFAQDEGGRRGRGPGGFGRGGFGFGGFGRTMDKPTLLRSDQVRTELKIGEEQAKKVDEVLASHQEASREIRGSLRGLRDLSDEERTKALEEMNKKNAELVKKTESKLAEVLKKEQMARLDQIALQQQGADALVAENVVASLKLSSEQVEKIKGVFKTRDDGLAELRPGRGRGRGGGGGDRGGFAEIREKMEKLRTDAETGALAVLSSEQKEVFTKLKGEPFELDRSFLRRGFGGGREGGGRRPGGGGGERRRPPADDL